MNIYLVVEDSVTVCIRARTMTEALSICHGIFVEECEKEGSYDGDIDQAAKYYQDEILESCTLVGALKN